MLFIDSFSAGLDDLTRRQQGDMREVLRCLDKIKRFSCFEASDNKTIANTVTKAFKDGLIEEVGKTGYPWTKVRLTDAGRKLIEG